MSAAGVAQATGPRVDASDEANCACRTMRATRGCRGTWSPARLSAAVAITRPSRVATPFSELLCDELEFFKAVGTSEDVGPGVAFMRRGESVHDVYLVVRGAIAAVVSDTAGRRPIVAFALKDEVCCAIPALLHEPLPWDGVTVAASSLLAIPAERFNDAVRDRWADRWATRALWWLTEFGARANEIDEANLANEVAALLLRHRAPNGIEGCSSALADVLDVDDDAIEQVLAYLRRLGAIQTTNSGVIRVTQPDKLHNLVADNGRRAAAAASS